MTPTATTRRPPAADETLLLSREAPAANSICLHPLRVLFLNTRDRCGADVAVHLSLMRAFDRGKAQPFVLSNSQAIDAQAMEATFGQIPGLDYRFAPLGVPAERLARLGKTGKARAMAPASFTLLSTLAYLRRAKIDVIHATDRPRDAAFSSLLSRLSGKPNVVHMHTNCGDHLSRATLWGLRHAGAVFAISEFTRKGLIELGLPAEKIFVVHNATDAAFFDPEAAACERAGVRRQWGIPREAPLVGIVARLIPWKGQRELIEAVARLSRELPNLHLMIVGEGQDKDTLRRLAEKRGVASRVIFAGWHDDVRPLLASFDLFALPSYEEPFGLAITEAMAMGLPVIACNSGGVPEIIEHGENGWLIEPRSVDALADAIRHLLHDKRVSVALGAQARQRVQEQFDPRQQADLVSDIYGQLIGPKASPKEI